MLSRTPSLARRAAIVFASVYAAILIAVLLLNAAASWADRGAGNLRGPGLAIDYAFAELRQVDGRLRILGDGHFADLAARNPSMWLMVISERRAFSVGAVPGPAAQAVTQLRTVIGVATFRLPGVATPISAVSLQRRESAWGPVLIAAGGVDPATLTAGESIDMLLEPGVVIMLAVIGVISLLAMLFAIPSFSRALWPITVEAGAIGPLEPGRRLDGTKAPKELLPLVGGFNAALDRLEVEFGRRKRFIADVAHEMRTPLAVISLQVEALAGEASKADLRRAVRGLTHLVSQMLDLERLSLSSGERSSVDLVAATRDVVADLAPIAINGGYDLSLDAPDQAVMVTADLHAISRAMTNLIANAIVHAGNSGRIRVAVGADRTVDVVDEGAGVPAALLPQLFEPFTRGTTGGEGSGLGLHIVREIMRSHGGEVRLLLGQRGARFRLGFPPAQPGG